MEGKELVSVIVPVFNRAKLVTRTLDSIYEQTYRPIELIIVDNNSSDNSLEVIEQWQRRFEDDPSLKVILTEESRRGASNARNKGLELAAGDFILFFDSDDTMRPNLIEEAMNVFYNFPSTDLVCWQREIHGLDNQIKKTVNLGKSPFEDHIIHALLATQGYLAKKEIIEKAGAWNPDLTGWDDWELGTRILLTNPKIRGLKKVLVDIFSQEESLTGIDFSSKEGIWENAIEASRKAVESSTHPHKKKIDEILTYREVILAAHYAREGNEKGAERLLDKSLKQVSGIKKKLLKFAYNYTLKGGRGAWTLIRKFY